FEANLARGEGALAPAMLIASDTKGDYAFLSLKAPAFDLSDRGVSGRAVPAGLDAFVYAERGVYRSGETVQVTALLRDGQGVAALPVRADRRGRRGRPRAAREPPRDRYVRQSVVPGYAGEAAHDLASARGAGHGAHGRVRRARGRAQAHAAGHPRRADDRRQA